MKISLDMDGTCIAKSEFFRELMVSMQARGHKVGILTGRPDTGQAQTFEQLSKLGFPKPDFYFGRTPEYMPLNGAHFKSMVIKREKIEIHFDDYDYDNKDTIKIFADLGQEERIARLKATEPIK
jgi:hydroxymethylpyrimidine pyrophosphatase-like HAD family hydrolase